MRQRLRVRRAPPAHPLDQHLALLTGFDPRLLQQTGLEALEQRQCAGPVPNQKATPQCAAESRLRQWLEGECALRKAAGLFYLAALQLGFGTTHQNLHSPTIPELTLRGQPVLELRSL